MNVAAIRARHALRVLPSGDVMCMHGSGGSWPCDAHDLLDALDEARAQRDELARRGREGIAAKWTNIITERVERAEAAEAQRDSARDIAAALEAELADRDTACPCTPFVAQLATAWDEGARSGAAYPTIMARNPYRALIAGETS